VVTYVGLALFWLAVSIWIRLRTRRAAAAAAFASAVDGAASGAVVDAVGGAGVVASLVDGAAAGVVANATDGAAAGAAPAAGTEAAAAGAATAPAAGAATAPAAGAAIAPGAEVVAAAVDAGSAVGEGRRVRLWLRVLLAAWAAELLAGLLTFGAVAYAEWTSTPIGADVLRAADLCSPWWSCVAAVLVVARAERSTIAVRAIAGYAALLAIVLLVPLPGPDAVKVLLLAVPAAVPAMLTSRQAEPTEADLMRTAVVAG
jgi:hypothetical protein